MTDEVSYFWDGLTPGDAAEGYHPSATYAQLYELLLMTNKITEGVVRFYENKLLVSNPAGNTIRIPSGAALVAGRYYENDANIDTVISTPSIATRFDRAILRCDFSAQTIRAIILTGSEGGGVPALTQNSQYWDVPLATISITTIPVITITDERTFAVSKLTDFSSMAGIGWTQIDSIEVDGTVSTFTFEGDFTQYTHLAVLGSLRHTHTDYDTKFSYLAMILNASMGNAYHKIYGGFLDTIAGAPSQVGAPDSGLTNYLDLGLIASDAALAYLYTGVFVFFHNPIDTSAFKVFDTRVGSICGSHANPSNDYKTTGLFQGLPEIWKIEFYNPADPTGFFVAGSNLQLYGIEG